MHGVISLSDVTSYDKNCLTLIVFLKESYVYGMILAVLCLKRSEKDRKKFRDQAKDIKILM